MGRRQRADQTDDQQAPIELGARQYAKGIHRGSASASPVAPGSGKPHDRFLGRLRARQHARLASLAHHQDPIRKQQQLQHFGAHHHDAQALRRQLEDELIYFLLRSDVDAARRLVEQQNPRFRRQPFSDHDLLLIAAGKRRCDLLDAVAAHGEPLDHVVGERRFAREDANSKARQLADGRQRDIVANRRGQMQAARLTVLGHQRNAEPTRLGGRCVHHEIAVDPDLAAAPAAGDPEDRFEDLRATRSEQAADFEDFAAPQIETHAMQHAPPPAPADRRQSEIAHREDRRARGDDRVAVAESDVAANHGRDDGAARKLADRRGEHPPAIAKHGHSIGESDDFVDAVRGEDDCDARRGELPHDLEQRLALRGRQRRSRLVHDKDARVQRQRFGDFDQLLLADAQFGDAIFGVEVDVEPAQQRSRGLHDAASVDDRPGDQRLAAEEDIVGRRQFGNEIQLLMNDRDAGAFRVLDAAKTRGQPSEPDRPFVFGVHAGENLHQRALAGAVFSHQRVHFAALQIEVDIAQRRHAGEGLGNARGARTTLPRAAGRSIFPGSAAAFGAGHASCVRGPLGLIPIDVPSLFFAASRAATPAPSATPLPPRLIC